MTTPSTSPRFVVNWTDLWKSVRGALVVLVSVFVLSGLSGLLDLVTTGNVGQLEIARPVLIAIVSAFVELARRYITDYSAPRA